MVAIVVVKSASMPHSCWGRYVSVSVCDINRTGIEWDDDFQPVMASARCRTVDRVLWDSGPVSVGKSERCASARAKARAEQIARDYNNARDMATAEQIIGAGGSA